MTIFFQAILGFMGFDSSDSTRRQWRIRSVALLSVSSIFSSTLLAFPFWHKGDSSWPIQTQSTHQKLVRELKPVAESHRASIRLQNRPSGFVTLLSPNGQIREAHSADELRQAIRTGKSRVNERTSRARAWLTAAEIEIGRRNHVTAVRYLKLAMSEAGSDTLEAGIARFDTALARFLLGEFEESAIAFDDLLRSSAPGYSKRAAMLLLRRTQAVAAEKLARQRAGIREPKGDYANSGLAAVQSIARLLNSRPSVLRSPYEEAPSTAGILQIAEDAGLEGVVFDPTIRAIRALLKETDTRPLIVHVGRNRYALINAADEGGLTYQEIGDSTQRLSWEQWQLLHADSIIVLAKKDSPLAEALTSLPVAGAARADIYALWPFGNSTKSSVINERISSVARRIVTGASESGSRPSLQSFPDQIVPMDSASASSFGSGAGDPVNLATLGEEYSPGPDLVVYNGIGPSITWRRFYSSLGTLASEFGDAWSHPYNIGVEWVPVGVGNSDLRQRTIASASVVLPNGSKYTFNNSGSTALGGSTTSLELTPETPTPFKLYWELDPSNSSQDRFRVLFKNRSFWVTDNRQPTAAVVVPGEQGHYLPVSRITNRMGQYLSLVHVYDATGSWPGTIEPRLTNIKDSNGDDLLTINIGSSGDRNIQSVVDKFGRKVIYNVDSINSSGVSSGPPDMRCLTAVSEIVTSSASSGPARYEFGYKQVGNGNSGQTLAMLGTISVPSPTGTGTSTSEFFYNSTYPSIQRIVDENGNQRCYTAIDFSHTRVEVKNSSNTTILTYAVGFNGDQSLTDRYWDYIPNETNTPLFSLSYSGSAFPLKPSVYTDGYGHEWTFEWDAFGNILGSLTPKGISTEYTYDDTYNVFGELTQVEEEGHTPTSYVHDDDTGLVTEVHSPVPGEAENSSSQQTTTISYDSLGNVTEVEAPGVSSSSSHTTTYSYDYDGTTYIQAPRIGEPVCVTDSEGKKSHIRYDSRGNVTSVGDALGHWSEIDYNDAQQATETRLPTIGSSGHTRVVTDYLYLGGPAVGTSTYDESNSLVHSAEVIFGDEGELLASTGDVHETHYTYNAAYAVTAMQEGASSSHTTLYYYDAGGLPFATVYPENENNGGGDEFVIRGYDVAGNVEITVDGLGHFTTYERNDANSSQVTDVLYDDSSCDVSAAYDDYDRPVEVADGTGFNTCEYDALDNVVSATRDYEYPNDLPAKTFTYEYNPDGSRHSMAIPGSTWTYSYDSTGRYTSMSADFGSSNVLTSSATYNDDGWQTSRTLPNGNYTSYTYNAVGMLTGLTNKASSSSSTAISSFTSLAYDGKFNLTGLTTSVTGASGMSGTIGFSYDSLSRLTQETSNRYGGYTENNTFDSSGNPTQFRSVSGLTYNSDNQRTGSGYEYDGNGNPTTFRGNSVGYDQLGRMTSFGSGFEAGYRADGLRAYKHAFTSGNEASGYTYYLYDGGNAVCELDDEGDLVNTNIYAPDGLVASRTSGGTTTCYLFDHQGNTSETVIGSTVSFHLAYNAWGQCNYASPTSEEGPPYLTHAYNARWGYLADETGLYYCQNRYYDPVTGRFLTRDPIGYDGGANLYGYCGGNPVQNADPSGLLTWQSLIEFEFGCLEGSRWLYDPIGNACESGLNTAKFEIYALGHPSEAWHQFLDSWNFWDAPDARTAGRRLGPWVQLLGCVAGGIAARIGPLSTSEAAAQTTSAPEAAVQTILRGRRGGPIHRAVVQQVEEDFKAMGYKHISGGSLPEKMMNGRYADLAFESNGKLELVQVGRVGKNGLPVAREWDAGGDLAGSKGSPIVHFVPFP